MTDYFEQAYTELGYTKTEVDKALAEAGLTPERHGFTDTPHKLTGILEQISVRSWELWAAEHQALDQLREYTERR
jgi:hypothetical protein